MLPAAQTWRTTRSLGPWAIEDDRTHSRRPALTEGPYQTLPRLRYTARQAFAPGDGGRRLTEAMTRSGSNWWALVRNDPQLLRINASTVGSPQDLAPSAR